MLLDKYAEVRPTGSYKQLLCSMQVHVCVAAGQLVEDMNISKHYTKRVQRKQKKREKEEEGMPKK
jgi:hypothetical protein